MYSSWTTRSALPAGHPRERSHGGDTDTDGDVGGPGTERRDDAQRQQESRQCQQDVDQSHDDRVDGSTKHSCGHAEERADDEPDRGPDHGAVHRVAGAVHNAGERVPTRPVGAEPVVEARWQEPLGALTDERVVAGEPRGKIVQSATDTSTRTARAVATALGLNRTRSRVAGCGTGGVSVLVMIVPRRCSAESAGPARGRAGRSAGSPRRRPRR